MNDASIVWRRLDHPGHESARVWYQADSWNLEGTAVFSHEQLPCRLDYRIVCDSRWHTRSAKVAGWVGKKAEVRAAGLRFPSFKLEPLAQLYRRIDETTYRYESSAVVS